MKNVKQEKSNNMKTRHIYSIEEAAHSGELFSFMEENGFCDVYDFFQSDPDILRIMGSEISFTEVDIDEKTSFVIFTESKITYDSEIKEMLSLFYTDNFQDFFTNRVSSWALFRSLVSGIAYRGGRGYCYTIWEYKD